MGHGEDGLASLIGAIAIAMVAIGFSLLFALGWLAARRFRLGRGRTIAVSAAAGLGGIALGSLAVTATFLESTWAPPPHLRIVVSTGFKPHWVILLEDPSASRQLVWHGYRAPFHGISSEIAVPPGGVVRVRSLAELAGRGGTDVEWSDGSFAVGFATGGAPAGAHASDYVAYERQTGTAPTVDILPDGDALMNYIRSHGG